MILGRLEWLAGLGQVPYCTSCLQSSHLQNKNLARPTHLQGWLQAAGWPGGATKRERTKVGPGWGACPWKSLRHSCQYPGYKVAHPLTAGSASDPDRPTDTHSRLVVLGCLGVPPVHVMWHLIFFPYLAMIVLPFLPLVPQFPAGLATPGP